MFGFLNSCFDFNYNAELSALERTAGYALYDAMVENEDSSDDDNYYAYKSILTNKIT